MWGWSEELAVFLLTAATEGFSLRSLARKLDFLASNLGNRLYSKKS